MSGSSKLRELPVGVIDPNLSQPRRYFDEETLNELAVSVRERGVLQPVLVRPLENGRYGLIVGERRWRAAKLAGLESIPTLVSNYDDLAALEVGLIENMARENLNPVEEARACVTLARECGLTFRQIADRVGRGHVTVWNLMHLLELSEEILELLERGELSKSHGTALLVAEDPQVRLRLAREAIERGWSTRTLEARARESNMGLPESRQDVGEEEKGREGGLDSTRAQAHDETAMNVARVWGDALGAEVTVRSLPSRKLRVELIFDSPEGAFALGGQIAEQIARGTKRR
jgi:ParB family chromosome partitioning protein